MRFLPIVERELRVASRKPRTYWTRFIAALTAITLIGWMLAMFGPATGDPQSTGKTIFISLATIGFFFAVLAGVHTTADCISIEKREGTLGLLFLTDLKSYDIVFGKLAATSLNAFYSLLAILPVIALPLLMGSVSLAEFGRMTLVLLVTLFFSLSAGICASSLLRKEGNVAGLCFLLIFSCVIGAPVAGLLWQEFVIKSSGVSAVGFFLPSPGFAFVIESNGFASAKNIPQFWWSLIVIHAMSWLFVLVALVATPRSWKDTPLEIAPKGWRKLRQDWNFGAPETRRKWRTHLLEINPVLWLSARNRSQFFAVWFGLAAAVVIWLGIFLKNRDAWLESPLLVMVAFTLNSFLKLRLIPSAVRRFAEDRRDGALELLLSTPTTVKEILRGQLLAIRKQFAGPIIVVLLLNLLLLFVVLNNVGGRANGSEERAVVTVLFVVMIFFLVADIVALSWVGMWQGLTAKNFTKACSTTATQILFLPWAIYLGVFFTLVALQVHIVDKWEPGGSVVLWCLTSLIVDVAFTLRARLRLVAEFRSEAMRRYQPRKRWWFSSEEAK